MNVTLVTAVCGRHIELERVVRCFLNQTYKGNITHLIYNNSPVSLSLADGLKHSLPLNRDIILVNNHLDKETGEEYTNTGAIFRDALTHVPRSTNLVNHFDSDDIFLPHHVSSAVYALTECILPVGRHLISAYKPYHSYCLYVKEIFLDCNNMEPSIFIDYQYIKEKGYIYTSASYNDGWLKPLYKENRLYSPRWDDPSKYATLIYNWREGHNNYKISGLGDSPENFKAHRKWERDNGDKIVSPAPKEQVEYFYNLVKDVTKIKGE